MRIKNLPYPVKKFVTPCAAKISSFGAIRAGMEMTAKVDQYSDFEMN